MAIDGTDIGSPIPDLEMDQCSYECSIKQECEFWLFKDALCYLKSGIFYQKFLEFFGSKKIYSYN